MPNADDCEISRCELLVLGAASMAATAAIANAIYNATGVRVRNYPITLDKLISQLHSQ